MGPEVVADVEETHRKQGIPESGQFFGEHV